MENLWNVYDSFDIESKENEIQENNQTKEISNETPNENICIKCNMYSDFKKEDGYNWCTLCGENNGIVISSEPEWRYYGSED